MLQLNGFGKGGQGYIWTWDREKVRALNEEELLNLIQELAWT